MRDVLQIAWGLDDQPEAFHKLLPSNGPITVNFDVFQQFVLSRQQVLLILFFYPIPLYSSLLYLNVDPLVLLIFLSRVVVV